MPDITMQQLETFLTVAGHLSFSEAAKALYISQPALSNIVLRLEKGVGTPLFLRKSHGVQLTREGEFLYHELLPLYSKVKRAIRETGNMSGRSKKTLKLACHTSFDVLEVDSVFQKAISGFKALYPDVRVSVELYEFRDLRSALITGDADVVYAADFVTENLGGISGRKLEVLKFFIMMSVGHRLASGDTLPLAELNDEVFYFVAPSFAHEGELEFCRKLGFTPKEIILVPNFPSVVLAVRQRGGLGFCANTLTSLSGNEIKYYPIENVPDPPGIGAAWRTHDLSKEARDFIGLLPELTSVSE